MRVLLLGGTGEARELAARLHSDVDVISSLAGRVPDPALPAGPVRVGGFGGVRGLRDWIATHRVGAVVDATHPFAARITANAAQACSELGVAHLVLSRPPWDPGTARLVPGDNEAAETVAAQGYSRVFLTTGRSGLGAFTGSAAWFLIRVVSPPDPNTLPRNHQLVLSRGPYRYEDERALISGHRIEVLVTKNSGGSMTRAKLDAADALGVDVVMIDRPPLPPDIDVVSSVDRAECWVRAQTG